MKTNDFNYELPESFIAQTPVEPRDTSRLLVYRRLNQSISHIKFDQLMNFLNPGDVLVLNQTRVYPARLFGKKKPGGGKVEILLLKQLDGTTWTALVGGKGLVEGREVDLQQGYNLKILQVMNQGKFPKYNDKEFAADYIFAILALCDYLSYFKKIFVKNYGPINS